MDAQHRPISLLPRLAVSILDSVTLRAACSNVMSYSVRMIKTFAHKGLERFHRSGSKAGIQALHAQRLRLILALLEQARVIEDMNAPSLSLHPLRGDLAGRWAVTVQANWRVIFRFKGGDVEVVNYLDYH